MLILVLIDVHANNMNTLVNMLAYCHLLFTFLNLIKVYALLCWVGNFAYVLICLIINQNWNRQLKYLSQKVQLSYSFSTNHNSSPKTGQKNKNRYTLPGLMS